MIWLAKRKKRDDKPPPVEVDREGAREAREHAERQLRETRAQAPEVRNIVEKLRVIRERNGFAEIVGEALSGTQDDIKE